MTMDKLDKNQIFYQESCNERRQYESMLFQRLNYYLVAIAFLVAAFVELAVNKYVYLALFMGGFSFALSWFYAALNYHNTIIMQKILANTAYLEKQIVDDGYLDNSRLPYNYESRPPEYPFGYKTLVEMIKDVRMSFRNEKSNNGIGRLLSPHTWLVPYSFILFWLGALIIYIFCYLKHNLFDYIGGAAISVVFLLFLLPMICSLFDGKKKKSIKLNRQEFEKRIQDNTNELKFPIDGIKELLDAIYREF
jgi:hypothetical protein